MKEFYSFNSKALAKMRKLGKRFIHHVSLNLKRQHKAVQQNTNKWRRDNANNNNNNNNNKNGQNCTKNKSLRNFSKGQITTAHNTNMKIKVVFRKVVLLSVLDNTRHLRYSIVHRQVIVLSYGKQPGQVQKCCIMLEKF